MRSSFSFRTLLVAASAALALPLSAAADRVVERTFEADPDVRLDLEAFKGKIAIRTAAEPTVRMIATITPDEGPEADVDLVEIRSSGSGSSVRIEVDYDRVQDREGRGWFEGSSLSLPFVDFELVVPDGASLRLESHKSTFDVDAPAGRLEIDTHKGEGRIRNVRGDFELDTHKGTFDVEIARLEGVRVDTHKGDVELRIAGAEDFAVRGGTHKGDLRFRGRDVPVRRGDDDELFVDVEVGSGRHLIELDTHKGSIEVAFE